MQEAGRPRVAARGREEAARGSGYETAPEATGQTPWPPMRGMNTALPWGFRTVDTWYTTGA